MLLADMDVAVTRIARALRRGERILVYGDYDVDGICSLTILKHALELLGGTVDVHVPHRLREGYGLQPKVITEAVGRNVTLLVTVDTGIRSLEAVNHARSLGLDVIVIIFPKQNYQPQLPL